MEAARLRGLPKVTSVNLVGPLSKVLAPGPWLRGFLFSPGGLGQVGVALEGVLG